jgi:catechol 2,3-dioxygenase-like lactoylglutathione lyase family enzyme
MLGRFLELSVPTPDVRASLQFYLELGFAQAEVGEAWPHAYAVVTDGRICLGLHEDGAAQWSLTFVRPGLLGQLSALEALGVEFESRRLGNDVFNEVAWRDPAGHGIRLVEARTFSPVTLAAAGSACGYFLEVALPEPDIEAAKTYWERLGFVGMDESDKPLPHVCCTSDSIDIGLHDPVRIARAALLFDAEDPRQRIAALAARGIEATAGLPPSLRQTGAHMIVAPEGTPILIANMG